MPDFIPGLDLSRLYYKQAVRPVIEEHFPGIPHSAALVGAGSEVLGFDSEMSIDHCWGPRLQLFLHESDYHKCSEPLRDTLSTTLPTTFLGYSTEFSLVPGDHAPVELRADERSCRGVQVFTASGYASKYLSLDVSGEITPADWLTCPQQLLKSFTVGKIYHDEVGLQPIRDRFAYYSLRITPPRPTKADHFFDRPFRVIHLHGGLANAICERIEDPRVQELVARRIIGNIDQISDSTDLVSDAARRHALRQLY